MHDLVPDAYHPSARRSQAAGPAAEDVDRWLAAKAHTLSTSTLRRLHSCLNRAISRARGPRPGASRNVVALSAVPQGQPGRPSKALTMAQAEALLTRPGTAPVRLRRGLAAHRSAHRGTAGAHLGSCRSRWRPGTVPPVPPHVAVWRSVRAGGDTKTSKSRRTLALPRRCIDALRDLAKGKAVSSARCGFTLAGHWPGVPDPVGTPLRSGERAPGLSAKRSKARPASTPRMDPRELRHSFVSLLSDSGIPVEQISRLVGHREHGRDRDDLPQADPARLGKRSRCHGPHLPGR